ncbi:MAG: tetratricopeptide repeat-containing glycosyltransferase family protein [Alphaproteobacteria bacterium]|nr:tetratricopeptide repeat-containing glycosyltransferase family protein [Alphaproteobacteria bacterium]
METAQEKFDKAVALHQAGKIGEAAAIYRDILMADPNNVMVIHLLCLVAMQFDNAQMVLGLSEQGLRVEPKFAVLHQDRATALRRMGLKEQALEAIDTALRLEKNADFYDTRASILRDMRRYAESVTCLETAIRIETGNPKFYNNLGIVLGRMGRNEEAICYFDAFITMRPTAAEGYNNKANVLKAMARYKDAIEFYDKALAIDPNIFMGKANKAISHLVLGEWEAGWENFEDRKPGNRPPEGDRFNSGKRWQGQTDNAATIIIYNEQGLGDSIQFMRYIAHVQERVGRVILQIQPALKKLVSINWPWLETIAPEDELPAHDYQCPLMSLPYVFKTRIDNVPLASGYIKAPEASISEWKEKLGNSHKKKIGLVWAGNPDHLNDHIRSIPLKLLEPILSMNEFQFYSLQKGDAAAAQLAELPKTIPVKALGDQLNDFTDTAGLLMNLDLLICVDTSVLHLAGALGVPVWGLFQYDPDWRWLLERRDTPWYASMRLFRQQSYGNWPDVVKELRGALKSFLSSEQI